MITKKLQILLVLSVLFLFGQHASAEVASSNSCEAIKSGSLKFGVKSNSARALQVFLNTNPKTQVAPFGPGSPGFETNYFGKGVASAVKRFQELHKAELLTPLHLKKGTGFVGVNTRLSLLASCRALGAKSDNAKISVSPNTALSSSTLDALIKALSTNTGATTTLHINSGGGGSGGGGGGGGGSSTPTPATPTIAFVASSTSLLYNGTTTLSWGATNATSCSGSWATSTVGISGSYATPKLATSTTYALSCVNGTVSATSTLDINVAAKIVRTPAMNEFLAENSLVPSQAYTAVAKNSWDMNSAIDLYSDDGAMPFRLGQPSYGTALAGIPTFESIGLYWAPPTGSSSTLASVRYRIKGSLTWKNALPLWFDPRNNEYRGSLVLLTKNTTYQIETWLPDDTVDSIEVKTLDDAFPVASTVVIPSNGTSTYVISTGGTASGYVVYTAASGTTTIDMGFAHKVAGSHSYDVDGSCVMVNAPYVIVRGLTLKNCQRDGVYIYPRMHDVVIEENDISGWGGAPEIPGNDPIQGPTAFNKVGYDYEGGVYCNAYDDVTIKPSEKPTHFIIQRNNFHDPRYGASSWYYGHPAGPQAVNLFSCGGNHVIRYNDLRSVPGHYMNDGFGGGSNFSFEGSSGFDTDIYGNNIHNYYDDGIESDGANRNVRVWGNYLAGGASGVSMAANSVGPAYLFRNIRGEAALGTSQWEAPGTTDSIFLKFGSKTTNPYNLTNGGRTYVFHNTALQPTIVSGTTTLLTMGESSGIDKAGGDNCNIVSRNNIIPDNISGHSSIRLNEVCGKNDLDYDLYRGSMATSSNPVELHGRFGLPTYHGSVDSALIYDTSYDPYGATSTVKMMGPIVTPTFDVAAAGDFTLATSSLGVGTALLLPNFNDMFISPDLGAHQSGTAKMEFGVNAYR